ncbi:Cyclic nucleotide-binding domain-containing protein [Desulfotomaculum arcticum]|uniref:Cyclic nucleotide-binding domain-containing protein n=2 Tax=Desulfotruncus TaxID=2867377 RepID=A0A1I2TJ58_9FIRM|nr:Cyclic nucleotide-binding domain-containing protein [Desulfotomaculum arcticum] [Desulfotruncus arcticus DSM 17038]
MDKNTKELIEHITTSLLFDETILGSEGLSSSVWDKYLYLGYKSIVEKGAYLLRIGDCLDGFYLTKKGKIESIFLGRDGIVKLFLVTGEGCLYGEQFIFHRQPGLFDGLVVEDAELYFFSKDTIYNIMKNDFEICLFIMKTLAIKSRMLAVQVEDMSLRNNLQKVCRILYTFCCIEEKKGRTEDTIVLRLSHQDIANMLASHRVTVTNNLAKLKKQGILDYRYEKIIIKDKNRLKMIAFE